MKKIKKILRNFMASLLISTPFITMPFVFLGISLKNAKFDLKSIRYSLNKSKPNLIFLYSDGLEKNLFEISEKNQKTNHLFDGFYGFSKLRGSGINTVDNIPLLSGNFEKYNKATILRDIRNNLYKIPQQAAYEGVREFMHSLDDIYSDVSRTQVNYVESFFAKLKKDYDDKDIYDVDFQKLRDKYANNGWGTSNLSPNSLSFKYLQNGVVSKEGVPAFVFAANLITHENYLDKNGDYKIHSNSSLYDAKKSLIKYLHDTFTSLKKIKNNETNAFDNSIIILWGDHTNHLNTKNAKTIEENIIKKTNPALFIKFPNSNNNKLVWKDDCTIYHSQIRDIIRSYFSNPKIQNNPIQIFNDSKYDANRKIPIFYGENVIYGWYDSKTGLFTLNKDEKNQLIFENYNKMSKEERETVNSYGN